MICICDQIECVCELVFLHEEACPFRESLLCPVGVECEHGFDLCLICDGCTCPPLTDFEERMKSL